ncbi:ferrous iron transport protein B [Siphonobacter sp. SORGH_AS_0500]|uniref:ferrous iron transport protein B n=1 Tax=Siphonobacter sp. SORGH_AS_0500 TaxID=1864824 RepID=UPI00285E0FE3|nr:ferrous iron transport protein B [Siphonobacter sp. SORGH_AS_0500]MDR6194528.1 ferrous iron transport protein B [Siphonobacter sp. SORGH_AS_0500]
MNKNPKIALVGNPNCGKTSLFNALTGLRQKTGNFPGVTVDRKIGVTRLDKTTEVDVIDLPGTYSLYPKSLDEQVVLDILANPASKDYPEVVVMVADASNLKRNLLLFSQVSDLGFHTILALNMVDVAEAHGLTINADLLSERLGVPVVLINAKSEEGLENLKFAIKGELIEHSELPKPVLRLDTVSKEFIQEIKSQFKVANDYLAMLMAGQIEKLRFLTSENRTLLVDINRRHSFQQVDFQTKETVNRYKILGAIADESIRKKDNKPQETFTQKLDKILLHPIWGYASFFAILFLIFQSIFSLAEYPMDWIDSGMASLNEWLKSNLPEGLLTSLLTDGLVAGIGGVVVFIPQIAFLFTFISLLEESGYMARVMVLMDKLMRKVGLNGRSVVPLISSVACAVPAIMGSRTIQSWKDRLITIMVTPLMSCSARLPIFTIMIGLVIPERTILGIFNLQGLALMLLYLLGFVSALLSAWVMKNLMKVKERSFFIMEMPVFQLPRVDHVVMAVWNAVKAFVLEAGKVIVAISIILWVLASYGPGDSMEQAEQQVIKENPTLSQEELGNAIASAQLETSYAGRFGHFIEPAIRPLGYDWKIGIALLTSFAAREVFVGTMSTIYSLGGDDDTDTVKNKMRTEINPETGGPRFTPAVAFSLLIFYVFAMMCMSTLAATYRETKSWFYPAVQFTYMTAIAYVAAWITFQSLS